MVKFKKGVDELEKGGDHKTYGIHELRPDGSVEHANRIAVYGDEDLRDRIVELLTPAVGMEAAVEAVPSPEEMRIALADLQQGDEVLAAAGERLISTQFAGVRTAIRDAVSTFSRLPHLSASLSGSAPAAKIECPTCHGDGNDITGIYDQCQNCDGTGEVSSPAVQRLHAESARRWARVYEALAWTRDNHTGEEWAFHPYGVYRIRWHSNSAGWYWQHDPSPTQERCFLGVSGPEELKANAEKTHQSRVCRALFSALVEAPAAGMEAAFEAGAKAMWHDVHYSWEEAVSAPTSSYANERVTWIRKEARAVIEAALPHLSASLSGSATCFECDTPLTAPYCPKCRPGLSGEWPTDAEIATVWRAAMTAACNIVIKRQNDLNDDDGPMDIMNEQGAIISALKRWLDPDEEYLHELRAMLAASPRGQEGGEG